MSRLSCIAAIISVALMCVVAQNHYSDEFDFIDVTSILADKQKRDEYFNCFLEEGPCVTDDEKFFKDIILEIIATDCEKCTDRQREMLSRTTDWYTKNSPDRWGKLLVKVEAFKNANR